MSGCGEFRNLFTVEDNHVIPSRTKPDRTTNEILSYHFVFELIIGEVIRPLQQW